MRSPTTIGSALERSRQRWLGASRFHGGLELRDNLDLVCLAILSLVLTLWIVFFPQALLPVRIVLAFVFLLLAPGYALTATLFPSRKDIDGVERLVLSVGLSIVAIPLIGLLLNATPWGIHLLPMTFGLAGFTLITLLLALYRRYRLAPGSRFFSKRSAADFTRNLALLGSVIGFCAAVILTAQALRPAPATTEFYILGSGGRLESFPSTLAPTQPFDVTLGIYHVGSPTESYRVHMPFAGRASDIEVPRLEDGLRWQQKTTLRAPRGSGRQPLSFELYRDGELEPFRVLRFFVTLSAASQGDVACAAGQPC